MRMGLCDIGVFVSCRITNPLKLRATFPSQSTEKRRKILVHGAGMLRCEVNPSEWQSNAVVFHLLKDLRQATGESPLPAVYCHNKSYGSERIFRHRAVVLDRVVDCYDYYGR